MLFKKEKQGSYDPTEKKPMIRASICNGEQVAGFKDLKTGAFEEIMLIRDEEDLDEFRKNAGEKLVDCIDDTCVNFRVIAK